MGMIKEFKAFAMKGSVVDLAVAVVIGAAFGKIVTSFVGDIIMPLIGVIFKVDFTDMKLVLQDGTLNEAGEMVGEIAMTYGNFITTVVDFILIAIAIFMVVKAINSTKKKEAPAAPPGPSAEVKLLTEIRDSLSK